jgi:hypothetical protein
MKKQVLIIGIVGVFLLIQPISAQTWTAAKRLTWTSGDSEHPAVAVDSGNTIHVVYRDDISGNFEIYYKKSTDGGLAWTTKRLTWTAGDSFKPAIALDSSNTIHVVWSDNTAGNEEIYHQRSTNGGVTWGSAKRLTWTAGDSFRPEIALDSYDTVHVVWTDDTLGWPNHEIYYRKSTDGGDTWVGTKRLTWNAGMSVSPAIALDSINTIHVFWDDSTTGNHEIYYKKSTDGGSTWGIAKRLTWNSGMSYSPVVVLDSSDNMNMVWYDITPGNFEIYFRRSIDGGTNWSAATRITWNTGSSFASDIAVDASGHINVAWEDDTPGNYEIYFKRSTNGGVSWSAAKRLTWNAENSFSPEIAVDSSSNIHVLWYDHTPGNFEIYYKKRIQ